MISKEQVKHIAKLARLELSEKEIEKFQKELSQILDYIKVLEQVDVSNTKPTFSIVFPFNAWREDEVKKESPQVINEIKKQMPSKEGDYLKVKEILK